VTAPARTTLRLRVTVADTWSVCPLEARKNESVGEVKRRALQASRIDPARADGYAVKVGGALVRDEGRSLVDAGVPDGGALVVLAARRRATR
jgi:hypothetical protein